MRGLIGAGVALAVATTGAIAEETRRELDAHQHGHGSLTIAIEGGQVLMALEVPGADIVGFEHVADSDDDKAKVAAAKAMLADPMSLFVLPAAAGCSVEATEVALVGDEHEDETDHEDEAGHDDHEDEEGGHAEFHAEYQLACAAPDELSSIVFAYFEAFSNAEELEVGLITEATQALYEVERDDPMVDLTAVR